MDYGPKNIENELPSRLDLCFALESEPNVMVFFTPREPIGNRTSFGPGKYKVKIRVDAENAAPVDGFFIIEFDGLWNNIKVSPATLSTHYSP